MAMATMTPPCLAGDLPHGPHVPLRVPVANGVARRVQDVGPRVAAGVAQGGRGVGVHALGRVGLDHVGVLHGVHGLHGDGVVAAPPGALLLQALAVLDGTGRQNLSSFILFYCIYFVCIYIYFFIFISFKKHFFKYRFCFILLPGAQGPGHDRKKEF